MKAKKDRTFLWMVVPAFVLFFAFHTFPVLQGVFFSFTDYKGYGSWDFTGLKNYFNVFKDTRALSAYGFTFQFAVVATILVNIISIFIALRSEEHTSELQSRGHLVCRLLLEKKK